MGNERKEAPGVVSVERKGTSGAGGGGGERRGLPAQ